MKQKKIILIINKKQQKIPIKGYTFTENLKSLKKGFFGIFSLNNGYLNKQQIEAFRRNIVRKSLRKLKIFKKFQLNKPLTFKPIESRMGKGKGKYSHTISIIRKGQLIFEILNAVYSRDFILEVLNSAKKKLPLKTKIIYFENLLE